MSDLMKKSLHEVIHKPISGARPKGGANFEGDIPSFGGENITMTGRMEFYPVKKISNEFFESMKRGHLRDLDVLINKDGANTGKSAVYRNSPYKRASVNEHLFILRGLDEHLDQLYLHYLLQSPGIKQTLKSRISGSAQPGLNSSFCHNFPIKTIPIPEQKKIASVLTSVDNVLENTQKQIDKLQDFKKATMNELLTKGINHRKFKDNKIHQGISERIPEGWHTYTIGELGKFYSGLTGKKSKDFGDGKPFITYTQVFSQNLSSRDKVNFVKINDGEKQSQVKYGDILFTISSETPNEVGMTSVFLDSDWSPYLNSFCFGLRLLSKKHIYPRFAKYFFRGNKFRENIRPLAQGSTRYNLSKESLKQLSITIPPLQEQKKIASILTPIDEFVKCKQKKLQQTQSLKMSLIQDLLTGKVRV